MKKLVSTVAALAVVAAMGATAFAAELPSPTTTSDITAEPVSHDTDYYEVKVDAVTEEVPDYVVANLIDVVDVVSGDTDVAAIDLVDVSLINKTTGEDVSWSVDYDNPVTVAFAFDDAQNVIAVLTWDRDSQSWIEADFEIDGDKVIATLEYINVPVTFVTKAVKADEPAKEDGKGSAQTGYDSLVYVVSAVALAAGAVFFFVSSKKSASEVM